MTSVHPSTAMPAEQPSAPSEMMLASRVRRLAAPACLVLVVLHVVLTCSSWRYTAPLLVLDISPSMLLASCALLFIGPTWGTSWWSPVAVSGGALALGTEQGTDTAKHSVKFADSQTGSVPDLTTTPAVNRTQEGSLLRKIWRKLAQAGKPPASSGRSQGRRHAPLVAQANSRSSMDSTSSTPRRQKASRGAVSGSRWAPSMSRITSGQHLAVMDDSSSVATSVTSRRQGDRQPTKEQAADLVPLVPHMGHLAVDCLHQDATLPHTQEINQAVTPQHLLQFGALLGESSAELALSQAGLPLAMGREQGCLLGATDNDAHWAQGWEQVAHEVCPQRGLHYCAWRRYLRKGLYAYKSRTVFDGVTPQQLAAFHFDDKYKVQWDDSCTHLVAIPPPHLAATAAAGGARAAASARVTCDDGPPATSCFAVGAAADSDSDCTPALRRSSTGSGGAQWQRAGAPAAGAGDWQVESAFARSCYMYARTRFPAPMAQREYIYARRVWAKADDGGCYMLSKITEHPAPPTPGGRVVRVQDFVSGTVVRASVLGNGRGPAAEMVTVYFEDSHVSAGIMNLGVRKALWPMVQKMEMALRKHMASPEGAALQVATSAALQQACFPPPAAAASSLRRCVSAAGSCRPSLDGDALSTPGAGAGADANTQLLQMTRSLGGAKPVQTAARGPAAAAPTLKRHITERYSMLATAMSARAAAVVLTPLQVSAHALRRLVSFLAAVLGMLLTALQLSAVASWAVSAYVRMRGRSKAELMADRHARVLSHPVHDIGKPATKIKWGKRLASRLALLAVRAVSVPLAHQMLNRTAQASSGGASGGWPSAARSDTMSVSSSHGGTSRMAMHGGRPGASGTQASMSESTARVRHWLDPAMPQTGYLLAPNTDFMQDHTAMQQMQQLQARRQPAVGSGLSLRPSMGLAVVDGVPLALERPPVVPRLRPHTFDSQPDATPGLPGPKPRRF